MSATYIIERTGWNQWYDDGGVWRDNRARVNGPADDTTRPRGD